MLAKDDEGFHENTPQDPADSRKKAQGKNGPTNVTLNCSVPMSPTSKTGPKPGFGINTVLDEDARVIDGDLGSLTEYALVKYTYVYIYNYYTHTYTQFTPMQHMCIHVCI